MAIKDSTRARKTYSFFRTQPIIIEGENVTVTVGVSSVFGRTNDVVAEAGDYAASKVTNDSTVSGSYVSDALNALLGGDLRGAEWWNTSSDDFGASIGPGFVNANDFTASLGRTNQWSNSSSTPLVATLPATTPDDHNRVVAFLDVASLGGFLNVVTDGVTSLIVADKSLGVMSATFMPGGLTAFRYDTTFDKWYLIAGSVAGQNYSLPWGSALQTANFNAEMGVINRCSNAVPGFTGSLPASPNHGDTVGFLVVDPSDAGQFITVDGNGKNIRAYDFGFTSTIVVSMTSGVVILKFDASSDAWWPVTSQDLLQMVQPGVDNAVLISSAPNSPAVFATQLTPGTAICRPFEDDSVASAYDGTIVGRVAGSILLTIHETTVTKGQALRLDASADQSALFAFAGDTEEAAQFVGGLANTSRNNGDGGYVQTAGMMIVPIGLQEDGPWTRLDRIYVSAVTSGSYTNVAPTTVGQYVVRVGRCLNTPAGSDALVLVEKLPAMLVVS